MILKTCLVSLAFLCLLMTHVGAQTSPDYFSAPKTFPVAPSAYEFAKYGDIPVSNYTGVPNISIPIYTIETGPEDLQIPITLTYHSNGFKVNEESGWTGLGWTLNEGGNIIQIVNGYDDFKTTHPNRTLPDIDAIIYHTSNGNAPVNYWTNNGCFVGQTSTSLYSSRFGALQHAEGGCPDENTNESLVPRGLFGISEKYDYEPDIFTFNFLGYSGKFVLDWDTDTFKCLTDPKIKVVKSGIDHKEITITTPEGHIFVFNVKEEAPQSEVIRDCSNCPSFDGQNGNEAFLFGAASRVYKLTDIYTNKGNHVSYTYTNTPLLYNFNSHRSEIVSNACTENRRFRTNLLQSPNIESFSYVSSINFNTGTIQFHKSDRLDFVGAKKLDRILVLIGGHILKTFDFNYSYFIGHTNGTNDSAVNTPGINKTSEELTHRLKLDSVVESGKPAYIFNYNTTQFPSKDSRARDYWGYYNGVLTNTSNFPNVYRFNYGNLPVDRNWDGGSYEDHFTGNNRSSRLQYAKAGILEKIIYPTGGYSEFEYELNSFTNAIVPNFDDTESTVYTSNRTSYGAGLRVKEIEHYDSDNSLATVKSYTYEGGRLAAPLLFVNKVFTNSHISTAQ